MKNISPLHINSLFLKAEGGANSVTRKCRAAADGIPLLTLTLQPHYGATFLVLRRYIP